jgi:RecA/RadA recombinase
MDTKEKLLQNTTIKQTATLNDSKIYGTKEMIPTPVPMINVAFSGQIDGGITPGLTMFAGPSKNFKTGFALLCMKAYLTKYDEGMILFYDSEFGTPQSYFKSFGIDMDRVIHTPITNIEEFKFDIMRQLDGITTKDKVMIVVDSIGNLASKKEVEDAMDAKSVADMTRAKAFKSLGRLVTPHLSMKNIPMMAINHTYKTLEMYAKDVVGGGTGLYYSADQVWILGRQQEKDDKEISGYNFVINVDKSRYVREKSKILISISWEGGINKWSGMLENALEHGTVVKPKVGWYQTVINGITSEKSYREKDISKNSEIWEEILKETDLAAFIKNKYSVPETDLNNTED